MTRAECDDHLIAEVASHSKLLASMFKKFTETKYNFGEKFGMFTKLRHNVEEIDVSIQY